MTFNLSKFRTNVSQVARPTHFQVKIKFNAEDFDDLEFVCQSSTIPSGTIGEIELPFFGRKIKAAGDKTFPNWSVNVINEENFRQREKFEQWFDEISIFDSGIRVYGSSAPGALAAAVGVGGVSNSYKGFGTVYQYAQTGEKLMTYKIDGIFPVNLGEIRLDWNDNNSYQSFDVEFAFDWWYKEENS